VLDNSSSIFRRRGALPARFFVNLVEREGIYPFMQRNRPAGGARIPALTVGFARSVNGF